MKKLLLFISLVLFTFGNGYAQQLWKKVANESTITGDQFARDSNPRDFQLFSLDLNALKTILAQAPSRLLQQPSNTIVAFPNAEGILQKYKIYEASVMHPDLAASHPEIQSYVGKGIDDPTATIRFSVTIFGLHAMTTSGQGGTFYIDTYTKDLKNYIVYNRVGIETTNTFTCGVTDRPEDNNTPEDFTTINSSNSLFKTYRLAMACTIEYAAFHVNAAGLNGGTLQQKKDAVLAAMNVTMTRVNGIYERDFSLTMVLVPNNQDIIFITSDDFDNANTNNILLDQSQTVIDAAIGFANYDIGHTVSTGGGGVAQLQSPCSNSKARGITGLTSPVGDPYDVDYVCHEMGHQFGCSHTFNGDQGGCAGNRSASSAFEPGSGSTIMSYSGLCNFQDIQNQSGSYFHARSVIQASSFINAGGNCAVAIPNGNTAPTVSAGDNYTIPFGTAFLLKGTAIDVDGDALTYCWEQYDNEISQQPPVPTSAGGPNFRSNNPAISSDRYFPKFSDVLANNLTPTWEVIPNVARPMEFSLVVRDNGTPLGGQTQRATMNLTFANTGPFKVTSQSVLVGWAPNTTENVTWDVAGTDANGINTALVNIKLSIDGGLTFPYIIAENTPNDGMQEITVPTVVSQNCRLMIEAVGNVYYALNASNFVVGYNVVNNCVTYNFDTPFALTDGTSAFTVKTITVPTSGIISDVNVTVNATHPNIQNLNIAMFRPGGSLLNLFNQQCAGNANMNVTFDAQGSVFTCGSPLQGTYELPTGSMNSLNGFQQQGNWQFGFRDLVAGDAGTINSFSLEVCTQSLVLATNNFEFENFALFPNPSNGTFAVQFHSQSNNKINIAVHDMRGRSIFQKSYDNSGMFSQNISVENAQSGIYLISIADGDKKIVKRIIIQ